MVAIIIVKILYRILFGAKKQVGINSNNTYYCMYNVYQNIELVIIHRAIDFGLITFDKYHKVPNFAEISLSTANNIRIPCSWQMNSFS